MKILITGSNGFIGKNIGVHLSRRDDIEIINFTKDNAISDLNILLEGVDFVIHLAGINRPKDNDEFKVGNADLTQSLCEAIDKADKNIPIIYASSIQAELKNPYGESKWLGENSLIEFSEKTDVNVYIFRLPNIFGKWCKPNYNSVVATFCHNVVKNIPLKIHDSNSKIDLVYIDDVIEAFINILDGRAPNKQFCRVEPIYHTTVGILADKLISFKNSRSSLVTEPVGLGLNRALHATFLSYLSPKDFSYPLVQHTDERGVFVEMLKTKDSGQFSFFSAHPRVTRGGHYHHTKTEKFLVLNGEARFKFRNVMTDEIYSVDVSGDSPMIVETVPGWTHDITNIGHKEMFVMLWANEIFDSNKPDTYAALV